MKFDIQSDIPSDHIYAGMIIAYKLMPLPGIKMRWVTEITHVKGMQYFVDEQRFGPYAFWHHQHFIRPEGSHTIMEDIVNYRLPLGLLGHFAHRLFVKKQLNSIFQYRYKALEHIFGKV